MICASLIGSGSMAFIRVNDIVTHFSAKGPARAPAIVFVNSIGADFRIWDAVAPAFSESMYVICYDKRGHGLSDTGSGPFSIDQYVDDLLGLLSSLDVARASVVGLSIGGMIAQRLAARAPEKIAALLLCDTAAKIGTHDMWAARIAAVGQKGMEPIADGILERWFTKAYRETRKAELTGWRNMLVRTPVQGYVGACSAIRDADLSAGAAAIKAPTLCVVGDEDGATPPDLVRAAASTIKGARFSIVERAGHLPCIEQPSVLVQLIKDHLQEARIV
ncbi:3-oxoadipate enol-lactonase [Methylocella tundrae]|uniref:3-oxoadipate enol-lactonase n=1 Tax=Methylocella tundrae TaxID=227605 RepID=UPI001FCE785E|nr:3-oxoadipate enol-lactonase [Methylocella tundrae]WPP02947.1 3-oxoadipate enol-lactonase [Methylocella tundrae]